jgi:membrane protein
MTMTSIKKWFSIFGSSAAKWWNDDPFRQSAVIAYYAIFSIPVLLVIAIDLGGIAFGQSAVRDMVTDAITGTFGHDNALQIQDMLAKSTEYKNTIVAKVLGITTLVLGATGVFLEMQKSLNYIWEAKPPEKAGIWYFIKTRLLSFGLIVSIGFLLAVSLIITSVLSAFSGWIGKEFSIVAVYLLHLINIIFSLCLVTVLFASMFKALPDTRVNWKHIWPGAFVTSVLFVLGKYGLGFYFMKFQPASIYGTAASVVLLLLWVSYSCMIVLLGAEFTRQYSHFKESEDFLKGSGT